MKDNTRSYICFVCFQDFENIDSFRQHIINNHEEGTDYVPCPSCKIPLRDVTRHFALRHPELAFPKNYPTKPIVIRDIKKIHKKKKTTYKQGNFFSKKNNKDLFFRSGMELEFYKILETKSDVIKYNAEPIEIDYQYEGGNHKYIPDILVEYQNNKKELWEIKPKSQTKLPKNQAKWQAANEYCKRRNWNFLVLTERGLRLLKLGKFPT